MDWRDTSREVITKVIAECERNGADYAEIRRRISAAYPFGPRRYWHYKVWLSEVKRLTKKYSIPEIPENQGVLIQ